jgi:hypothetical protein
MKCEIKFPIKNFRKKILNIYYFYDTTVKNCIRENSMRFIGLLITIITLSFGSNTNFVENDHNQKLISFKTVYEDEKSGGYYKSLLSSPDQSKVAQLSKSSKIHPAHERHITWNILNKNQSSIMDLVYHLKQCGMPQLIYLNLIQFFPDEAALQGSLFRTNLKEDQILSNDDFVQFTSRIHSLKYHNHIIWEYDEELKNINSAYLQNILKNSNNLKVFYYHSPAPYFDTVLTNNQLQEITFNNSNGASQLQSLGDLLQKSPHLHTFNFINTEFFRDNENEYLLPQLNKIYNQLSLLPIQHIQLTNIHFSNVYFPQTIEDVLSPRFATLFPKLLSLQLKRCIFYDDVYQQKVLGNFMDGHHHLKSLSLNDMEINFKNVNCVINTVSMMDSLVELNLNNLNFRKTQLKDIIDNFSKLKKLKKIFLNNMLKSINDTKHVAQFINKHKSIEFVDVRNNNIIHPDYPLRSINLGRGISLWMEKVFFERQVYIQFKNEYQ